MNNIGSRISMLIEHLSIKKSDFAKRLDITPAYVTQLCSSARTPSDRTIADICREFKVSEEWLRTGNGPMTIQTTRTQKIAEFMADVMTDTPDSIRSILVSFLADLDVEDWEAINKIIKKHLDK